MKFILFGITMISFSQIGYAALPELVCMATIEQSNTCRTCEKYRVVGAVKMTGVSYQTQGREYYQTQDASESVNEVQSSNGNTYQFYVGLIEQPVGQQTWFLEVRKKIGEQVWDVDSGKYSLSLHALEGYAERSLDDLRLSLLCSKK